jgi:hypothetical protein
MQKYSELKDKGKAQAAPVNISELQQKIEYY